MTTEAILNLEWSGARAALDMHMQLNTYGKTPIELAQMDMDYKKAQEQFRIIDKKVKKYVEDKFKANN